MERIKRERRVKAEKDYRNSFYRERARLNHNRTLRRIPTTDLLQWTSFCSKASI